MTTADLDQLKAEIERDVKAYSDTFVRANHEDDPSLMRPWMRLPVLALGTGSVRVLSTPEDVDGVYGAGVEALKGTGYADSKLSDFTITVLNPTTALALCHCVRTKEDGSVLQEFEASYLVAKGEDRWQIAALISRR